MKRDSLAVYDGAPLSEVGRDSPAVGDGPLPYRGTVGVLSSVAVVATERYTGELDRQGSGERRLRRDNDSSARDMMTEHRRVVGSGLICTDAIDPSDDTTNNGLCERPVRA